MKISNRLSQFAVGIIFLLACASGCLSPGPVNSDVQVPRSRLMFSTSSTDERTASGNEIRKLSLEITLISNIY